MTPIYRSELVYFTIAASAVGGAFIPFPDTPSLNGNDVLIQGFEVFTDAQLAFAPNRTAVTPAADALNMTLTLNEGSDERFKEVPYTDCVAQLNSGVWKESVEFPCDFQKSGIRTTGAVTGGTACVLFHYRRKSDPIVQ